MKKLTIIFLISLAFTTQAAIYKWTDSRGVVHFSDTPQPGAVQIDLPDTPQPNSQPPASTSPDQEPKNTNSSPTTQTETSYESVNILQPVQEATIRNNQGLIPIVVEVMPALKQGDMLQLIFDDVPMGKPQTSTVFAVNNVNRGTHTIAVQLLDAENNVILTSDTVKVYLHRPRVNMVPPSKRPNTGP